MYFIIFVTVRHCGAISPRFRRSEDKLQKETLRCKRIELHILDMNMHNIHKPILLENPERAIKRAV